MAHLVRHPAGMMADGRMLGIGGSDANRIVRGDWADLYREKIGEQPESDLSGIFRVQLGLHTETFHIKWHAKQTVSGVLMGEETNYPMHRADDAPGYRYASLDGWMLADDCPLEVKHTNEHNNLRDAAAYYMGQLQHIMLVTDRPRMRFSIIRGNNEPEWGYVDADEDYQSMLANMESQFWWHVTEREAPDTPDAEQDGIAKLGKQVPINGFKPYDYDTNNHFVDLALTFKANRESAARFEAAKKEIKGLVPEDASEVTCRHLRIVRSASGSLLFKEPT